MINALILPPMAWGPEFNSFIPGTAPDPFEVYEVLREQGINAEIIDPFPRPWNPFSGKDTLLDSLDLLRALKTVIRQRRTDIIVSVFEGGAAAALLFKSLGLLRTPICLWDIGLTESWRLRERILEFTVPRADAIMVLGSNQESYIRKRWNPKGSIHVIHHHVDATFFHPQPQREKGCILSVGDDVGRDFPTLVEAARGIDCEIVIKATRHPPAIPPGTSNIKIVRERISYCDLRSLYAQSSFVVVPTHETLNASGVSTILEASAMEKPLIVSDNSGIRDFVIPDETCLMVPREDPKALRDAVFRLRNDPAAAAYLAKNARRFVVERFHNAAFAKGLAKALKEIYSEYRHGH